jgi:hypothetical protein
MEQHVQGCKLARIQEVLGYHLAVSVAPGGTLLVFKGIVSQDSDLPRRWTFCHLLTVALFF